MGSALWSCDYDDDDLWSAVEGLDNRVELLEKAVDAANANIDALQKVIDAQKNNVTITEVKKTANGYTIKFSNGETAEIVNGKDGQNGANGQNGITPEISVKKDADGIYYWTINGDWLLDGEGQKVKAQGVDGANGQDGQNGQNGADAVAPEVRINPETKEWEISVNGGIDWTSTGIRAEGQNGDSFFQSVDTTDPNFVVFTLADGTQFVVAREVEFSVAFEGDPSMIFNFEETKSVKVVATNVEDYMFVKPDGWKASYAKNMLTITAPAEAAAGAEFAGDVAMHIVSKAGQSKILKMRVMVGKVLTFEDADYKGSGNFMGANDWSSIIDSKQNNGDLLYGSMAESYMWWDEGNTELISELCPSQWGMGVAFWNGGHAISNYIEMDLKKGSPDTQLSVYNAKGGHNGSKNFAINFGSLPVPADYENTEFLPHIYFADGVCRVVDHMYVCPTTYMYNSVINGDSMTKPMGKDGFVKIIAVGIDDMGKVTGQVEFPMVENGVHVTDWTMMDLSSLGKVFMIKFNMVSSEANAYGMLTPAYFAMDDVAVRL